MTAKQPAWTALDAGALPLPSGGSDDHGSVVAILATKGASEAGWGGTCAVALAGAWASAGHRVVLADLHLQDPTLHRELGLPNGEGISDILMWGASVRRVAQGVPDAGFYLVSAGTPVADAGSALASPRWPPLCEGFCDAGVTLATFLAQGVATTDVILEQASEVVIVARETEDLTTLVEGMPTPVIGVVGRRGPADTAEGVAAAHRSFERGEVAGPGFARGERGPAAHEIRSAHEKEGVPAREHDGVPAWAEQGDSRPSMSAFRGGHSLQVESNMEPGPATVGEGGETSARRDDAESPTPKTVGIQEAYGDTGAAAGRRRAIVLGLVVLVVLLGLLGAALLGYVRIPGIPGLSSSGDIPSDARMAAAGKSPAPRGSASVLAVDGRGDILSDRAGRLPV